MRAGTLLICCSIFTLRSYWAALDNGVEEIELGSRQDKREGIIFSLGKLAV